MLRQGIMLLTRFCQDDRIQIHQPQRNLQIKFTRPIAGSNDFVAYVDAIGKLDGTTLLTRVENLFKPIPVQSPTGCSPWTRSWFATRG